MFVVQPRTVTHKTPMCKPGCHKSKRTECTTTAMLYVMQAAPPETIWKMKGEEASVLEPTAPVQLKAEKTEKAQCSAKQEPFPYVEEPYQIKPVDTHLQPTKPGDERHVVIPGA